MKQVWYDLKVVKLEQDTMKLSGGVTIELKDKRQSESELSLPGWIKENKPTIGTRIRVTFEPLLQEE